MNKRLLIIASAITMSGVAIGVGSEAIASAQTVSAKPVAAVTHKLKKHDHDDGHIRFAARLNQAVLDGTINKSQEAAYKAELKTLRTERKSDLTKSSTKAERQAERTKLNTELQSWASSTGFPLSKIAPKRAS